MANADELCQFARLGQLLKIQKCVQTHNVDINALNLCGESALSTATFYNQIVSVEYLLANKADPKLRLSAGHTAIHIACRSANVPMLHLLLSVKKDESDVQKQQEQEDKHVYECLKVTDNAKLTPIHWAATHESVSKRQKLFAYLDKRMPGVLDSRYNINWFDSWARTHPWVIDDEYSATPNHHASLMLTNTDKFNRQYIEQSSSLPLFYEPTHPTMSPRASLNSYNRTPKSAVINTHDNTLDDKKIRRLSQTQNTPQTPKLPPTPITSRIVAFTNHITKCEHHRKLSKKQSPIENKDVTSPQRTPYFQRLTSIVKSSLSPFSDRSSGPYCPPSLTIIENKQYNSDETYTSLSNRRPSHNLLSNILPSTTTSWSDRSSQQSTKAFEYDSSSSHVKLSHAVKFTDASQQKYNESFCKDEYNDNDEVSQFDYLCKSTSSLDTPLSDV